MRLLGLRFVLQEREIIESEVTKMRLPRFAAETSLYQSSARYRGNRATGQNGVALHPAQFGPIPPYVCAVNPGFCESLFLNLKVNWVSFGNGSGLVIVQGSGFPGNRKVHVEIQNCVGAYSFPINLLTDPNGEFTRWVQCDCGRSTTVTADDVITGASVQATAQLTC
jgi:hypothetical protein